MKNYFPQKIKKLVISALELAALFLVVSFLFDWWRAPKIPDVAALDIRFNISDGRVESLRHLSENQPVLLYFWGSWCVICKHTSPVADRLAHEGYPVLGVALRSGEMDEAVAYLHRNGWHFPTMVDPKGAWSRQWQVAVTPTWALVKDGKIVFSTTGLSSYWGMKLRLWWASL